VTYRPRPLQPGSTIRVVSPASPVDREKCEAGADLLRGAGYTVEFGEHAFDRDGYLAGTDEDRAADLADAFADPGVDAVFCSRGGYGSSRIVGRLPLDAMAASGKLFCGFSDVTTLHLALNRRGLATLYCPMLLTLSVPRPPFVAESLLAALSGGDPLAVAYPRAETVVAGVASGVTAGGCLCLLSDSSGTSDAFDPAGKIVVIEDVDEPPHRVDAMLTQLLNQGRIQRAAGIVVGEMTRTEESADPSIGPADWRSLVRERLSGLGVPLVTDCPLGHAPAALSVPLGVQAELDAGAGTLRLLEPLCAP
jgi:muramoyltetrapeptide carboxypeptidase